MIQSPQDADKVNRFIIKLKRKEFDKNFIRSSKIASLERKRHRKQRKHLKKLIDQFEKGKLLSTEVKRYQKKMEVEKEYPITHIDEVE